MNLFRPNHLVFKPFSNKRYSANVNGGRGADEPQPRTLRMSSAKKEVHKMFGGPRSAAEHIAKGLHERV